MKTVKANNYPESKVGYLNREKISRLTQSWLTKITHFITSKYKGFFNERSYTLCSLTNDILTELKTVDFETTNQNKFILFIEKKILKKLSKKSLSSWKLVSYDNIKEIAPRPKSANVTMKVKSNDHQKQQLLNTQRTNIKGNLII